MISVETIYIEMKMFLIFQQKAYRPKNSRGRGSMSAPADVSLLKETEEEVSLSDNISKLTIIKIG